MFPVALSASISLSMTLFSGKSSSCSGHSGTQSAPLALAILDRHAGLPTPTLTSSLKPRSRLSPPRCRLAATLPCSPPATVDVHAQDHALIKLRHLAEPCRRLTPTLLCPRLSSLRLAHPVRVKDHYAQAAPDDIFSYQGSPISITTFLQPDICPTLETLQHALAHLLRTTHALAERAHARATHADCTLRRIGIRRMGISRLYPNWPSHAQDHFHSLLQHHTLFPALETVCTVGFLVDACTDQFAHDIFIGKFEEQGLICRTGRASYGYTPTLQMASRRSSHRTRSSWSIM
ncbi:uncharacterized protein C8Q71DRAFT_887296 [Rhodofomes roseus]|uniref:Uncharacterized protein n=1 Tax=Rhodofomes roseus TaxID=34475 RepID=A0ABQ8K0I6_9APHY|nr:uncharacterized protein C8Q71DRAFT_887296 [Rhodofomes roseus]KAH9829930.1 hypothetical protein C8Q71DRAFT_887296 [Rhodofomes roseus]